MSGARRYENYRERNYRDADRQRIQLKRWRNLTILSIGADRAAFIWLVFGRARTFLGAAVQRMQSFDRRYARTDATAN